VTSPFLILGLPASAGVTDDEVRAAWRRLAAATHPDRGDGGDPAAFAAAATAYTQLRTAAARREALTDTPAGAGPPGRSIRKPARAARRPARPRYLAARLIAVRLLPRLVIAAAAVAVAVTAAGWQPATVGIAVGALTWLLAPVLMR
jgi:hypothetical protein